MVAVVEVAIVVGVEVVEATGTLTVPHRLPSMILTTEGQPHTITMIDPTVQSAEVMIAGCLPLPRTDT